MRSRGAQAALLLALCLVASPAPTFAQLPTSTTTVFEDEPGAAERFPDEAERIREMDAEQPSSGADDRPRTLGAQLLQTLFMLVAICALAYLVLGKLLPRMLGMSSTGRNALLGAPSTGIVQVVDRLAIDPRRALMVVKVGDEHFLVGMTDSSMTQIARLDGSSLPTPEAPRPILGAFGRLLERRLDKEGT